MQASTRVLVLLDQIRSFAPLKFSICLLSRTGRETSGKRSDKQSREDDSDEEVAGAFSLWFK